MIKESLGECKDVYYKYQAPSLLLASNAESVTEIPHCSQSNKRKEENLGISNNLVMEVATLPKLPTQYNTLFAILTLFALLTMLTPLTLFSRPSLLWMLSLLTLFALFYFHYFTALLHTLWHVCLDILLCV